MRQVKMLEAELNELWAKEKEIIDKIENDIKSIKYVKKVNAYYTFDYSNNTPAINISVTPEGFWTDIYNLTIFANGKAKFSHGGGGFENEEAEMNYLEVASTVINGLNEYVKHFDDSLLEMLYYINKEQIELEEKIDELKRRNEFENITAKMNKITKADVDNILSKAKFENVTVYYVNKAKYYVMKNNIVTKSNRYYFNDALISKKKLTDLLINDSYYVEA